MSGAPNGEPTGIVRSAPPPGAWRPLHRFARRARAPLERFFEIEAASGIVLLVATAIALVWANSPWAEGYRELWHASLGFRVGPLHFERNLEWFVNDVLMVVFFFVVGMEIRREIAFGELSVLRRAALPAVAAFGGMVGPALVYLMLAAGPQTKSGWGVPMATDIAFAVGILTLLGRRVPAALRVLLLTLAVIDDLGSIVVIAAFYSDGVAFSRLGITLLGVAGVFVLQALGVRQKVAYVVPTVVAWAGIYTAGVHPTIAGVIVGLLTPVQAWLGPEGFVRDAKYEIEELSRNTSGLSNSEVAMRLRNVDLARREALSPAEGLIQALHPWVAFVIMPVFALANAGVSFSGFKLHGDALHAGLGVTLGLVLGKPVGILIASFLALRSGLAALPRGLDVRHLLVLGLVAGIGFTMAIFIANLAFTDPSLLAAAKFGVLTASVVAAALGLSLGAVLLSPVSAPGVLLTADDAERSTEG